MNFLMWSYQGVIKISSGDLKNIRLQSTQVWKTFLTKVQLSAFGAVILSFLYIVFYHFLLAHRFYF
ncbi:hypothetical protein [Bartonella bovis]|uniref:hypothetical protein n=1 Tax=Bartonella bovis TaxID=155194 RepID=UPI000AB17833